jgi:hypothetical protein
MSGTCIIRKDAFWECRNIGIRRNTDRGIYIRRYSGGGVGGSCSSTLFLIGGATLPVPPPPPLPVRASERRFRSTSPRQSQNAWTNIVWNSFSRPIGSRVHRPYMTMMMNTQVVTYLSHHFWSTGCDIAGIIVLIYTFWLFGGGRNGIGGSKGDDMRFLLHDKIETAIDCFIVVVVSVFDHFVRTDANIVTN